MPHAHRSPVAHLNFLHHSLSKNTVDCPEWQVAYELVKSDGVVTVTRRDSYYPQPFLVAQWERHSFHSDKLRFVNPGGYDSGLLPVDSIFPKTSGIFSGSDRRTFVALNPAGRRFTWKWSTSSLKLYHEEERATDDDALPIAEFKGKHIILYEDCYPFLDMLFVTGLIAEEKRRDNQTASNASVIGAVAGAS